jgi:hypothetical protein
MFFCVRFEERDFQSGSKSFKWHYKNPETDHYKKPETNEMVGLNDMVGFNKIIIEVPSAMHGLFGLQQKKCLASTQCPSAKCMAKVLLPMPRPGSRTIFFRKSEILRSAQIRGQIRN